MIVLGADHNGFALKEALKAWLGKRGEKVIDVQAKKKNNDDYPSIAAEVAKKVSLKKGSVGILICGSGTGMAIAANRFPRIRAALCPTIPFAKKAREDEDANVLVLSSWWMTAHGARAVTHMFLKTKFSGAKRHRRRINQLGRTNG